MLHIFEGILTQRQYLWRWLVVMVMAVLAPLSMIFLFMISPSATYTHIGFDRHFSLDFAPFFGFGLVSLWVLAALALFIYTASLAIRRSRDAGLEPLLNLLLLVPTLNGLYLFILLFLPSKVASHPQTS